MAIITSRKNDFSVRPITNFYFDVNLAGFAEGSSKFSKVSGLKGTAEYSKEEGNTTLIDNITYDKLVLERGLTSEATPFVTWFKEVFSEFSLKAVSSPIAKDITISLKTLKDGEEIHILTWNVKNATPVEWGVSDFDASNAAVVIETISLKYESFEIETN